ncbi:Haloacid dehalogenase-like hydrolase-domain-containing protein [Suillus subaureus]|uniref:Haloacid dehalogenase-like hydrolase-domain-containing protein n=1 Tax=Suillus subaureus TaxID=48587 RepID=A0A9P7EIY7_9AGAM|nr:Haloacid dehalogenase-like hydrolase-domain-containing protein [Suillus subaureus]KAG1822755.1 Haloacid dehalogenase-like hydrolase-domain-containing protein [Suillus subaureus]
MSSTSNYTTLIFDIGDVLFSWSPQTKTSISPTTLRKILSSPTWIDYEKGRISQAECYAAVGGEFSVDPTEVGRAFQDARDSLQSNEKLISVIRHLKAHSDGMLHVFAMSNISAPDYEVLRTKPVDWSLFDGIFTSAGVGERKPNLGFYKAVISGTGADPSRTIFVDDKIENVLSARSLGMHGIVFDDQRKVVRALYNLLGDPVERGRQYLTVNAKKLLSVTDNGIFLRENFSQLLILETTDNRSLVNLTDTHRTWNFFQADLVSGKPSLTTEEFPFDLDTTSLGLTVMGSPEDVAHSVMDDMLDYIDDDGIIQVLVCVNALTLFYFYGRGHQLDRTLHWIREVLLHRAYLDAYIKPLLIERVQERIGADGDALALSMRLRLCAYLGLRNDVDLRTLLPLQCEDGGWEIGWIYKYGSSGIKIGNRGLATSLAMKAILEMQQRFPSPPSSPSVAPAVPLVKQANTTAQSPPERFLQRKSDSSTTHSSIAVSPSASTREHPSIVPLVLG